MSVEVEKNKQLSRNAKTVYIAVQVDICGFFVPNFISHLWSQHPDLTFGNYSPSPVCGGLHLFQGGGMSVCPPLAVASMCAPGIYVNQTLSPKTGIPSRVAKRLEIAQTNYSAH